MRRGVVKLYAALRKDYAEQQQEQAARAAEDNAARLRGDLAAQQEVLEAALRGTPARELISRLGGLPVAAERGAGAASFTQPRSEAAQWQVQCRRQAAGSQSSGPAGSSSTVGSGAEAVGTGEHGQASEAAGDPRSMRPVPPQQLAATKGARNCVGGKDVPLQVGADFRWPRDAPCSSANFAERAGSHVYIVWLQTACATPAAGLCAAGNRRAAALQDVDTSEEQRPLARDRQAHVLHRWARPTPCEPGRAPAGRLPQLHLPSCSGWPATATWCSSQ